MVTFRKILRSWWRDLTLAIFIISTENSRQIQIYWGKCNIFRFSVHKFWKEVGTFSKKHKGYNLSIIYMLVFWSGCVCLSTSVFLRSRSVSERLRRYHYCHLVGFPRLVHVPHTRRKSMRLNFRWLWTVLVSIRRFKSVIQMLVLSKLLSTLHCKKGSDGKF